MKYSDILIFTFIIVTGCSPKIEKAIVHTSNEIDKIFFTEINQDEIKIKCERILPTKFTAMKVDYTGLRKLLLKPGSSGRSIAHDTIIINIPIPGNGFEKYAVTEVSVLPPELSQKYPEIKTFHGNSLAFPEDVIRMDISPNGFNSMILSTRGTIMLDPVCPGDSLHVITYFKKDMPEGAKQPFEK